MASETPNTRRAHRLGVPKVLPLVALALIASMSFSWASPAYAAASNQGTGTLAAGAASVSQTAVPWHYDKRVAPRKMNAHQHPTKGSGRYLPHNPGEVPPALRPGVPKSGRPPVTSDAPIHGKGKAGLAATTMPAGATAAATLSRLTGADASSATSNTLMDLRPLGAAATGNGNFENMVSFGGATLADAVNCGCEPPDTQVAVGKNQVVEAVNSKVLVFDRGGNSLGSFQSTDLFQPPGQTVGVSDPRILFDPSAGSVGRYYMTLMVFNNPNASGTWDDMGISIAISETDDPQGTWDVYDYIRDIGGNELDQEKLGFSGDKVTFAVNQYNCKCGSGSLGGPENVVVLQKSDLLTGASTTPVVTTSGFQFDSMPTTPVNTSDNTQYVVWNNKQSSSNTMGIVRITGTPNGGNVTFGSAQTPSIGNQTASVAAVQKGSCVDGSGNSTPCIIDSSRLATKGNFESAMVQGNQLWATGVDGCTPQYPTPDTTTRDCIRLIEVDLSGGGSNVVYDTDIGDTGDYRYNPSVMKDNAGHVFFGFTLSSPTQYATAATDASSLPPPSVFPRIDFASGDINYTGSRWGDYSGLAQDPSNTDYVWSGQEFGACATACSSGSGNWATELGEFTFAGPDITSVSPTSGPATGGTTVDIYGSGFANGANSGTSVTFGGTASGSVTFLDGSHIRAVSPAAGSGTVDIRATTLNGTSQISANDHFSYRPVVSSVSPNSGPSVGGQSVTIGGAGFTGATAVSFGGTTAASFTVNNGGSITAVTPADSPSTVDVTVTANGQTSATSHSDQYTFQFATTTALSSSANPSIVGQSVTFIATITPTPDGGTVAFTDNGSPIASCQTQAVNTSNGTATCTLTYSAVGTHSLTATYSGDFNYTGSTSSAFTQQVAYAVKALYDETKVHHSGADVAIKVQLQDAAGSDVSSSSIVLTVVGLSPSPAPGVPPSGIFTFMPTLDTGSGYQLNVKTTHYPSGTYTLSFTATGDPTTHTVQFIIG